MSNPGKGHADYWEAGSWDAVCWRCGFKFKAGELRKTWQGFYACDHCWEPRHPQDFVRSVPDNQAVPWSQPENWIYVGPTEASNIVTEDPTVDIITEDNINIVTE